MYYLRPTYTLALVGLIVTLTGVMLMVTPFAQAPQAERPSQLLALADRSAAWHPGHLVAINAATVSQLENRFRELGYVWDPAMHTVPRVALERLPSDLASVPEVRVRKRLFFQSLLPIILMENERILAQRQRLIDLLDRHPRSLPEDGKDGQWLRELVSHYRVKVDLGETDTRVELLTRINRVPLSLAMAMAAYESGWGTSRFVGEGNNLFGQWTYTAGTGMVPKDRAPGARHELAVFPTLSASVRAYLHNLNTHWAYADFRQVRADLVDLSHTGASQTLAKSLDRYSERGTEYTDYLARMIRVNRLEQLDHATLDAPSRLLEAIIRHLARAHTT